MKLQTTTVHRLKLIASYLLWALLWVLLAPSLLFLLLLLFLVLNDSLAYWLTIAIGLFVLLPLYSLLFAKVLVKRRFVQVKRFRNLVWLHCGILFVISACAAYSFANTDYGFSIPTNSYGFRYDRCVLNGNGVSSVHEGGPYDCLDKDGASITQP